MVKLVALLIGIAGLVLAAYVGIWVMLTGGIIQIVQAVQSHPIRESSVAWGVTRILFCWSAIPIALGFLRFATYLWTDSKPSRSKPGGHLTAHQTEWNYRNVLQGSHEGI